MNVSKEHLSVLVFARNCGERYFAEYFGKHGFYFKEKPLNQFNFAVVRNDLKDYDHLSKILCIDNPYRIIYSEFIRTSKENWKKKNFSIDQKRKEFSKWFDSVFYNDFDYVKNHNFPVSLSFLKINDLVDINFDFVVKKDTYYDDLKRFPFFDEAKLSSKLEFLIKSDTSYQLVLNEAQAKRIFTYFRPFFDKFGYDPFSFTNVELTKQEKVNFIHR
jgi:hypothetical protein